MKGFFHRPREGRRHREHPVHHRRLLHHRLLLLLNMHGVTSQPRAELLQAELLSARLPADRVVVVASLLAHEVHDFELFLSLGHGAGHTVERLGRGRFRPTRLPQGSPLRQMPFRGIAADGTGTPVWVVAAFEAENGTIGVGGKEPTQAIPTGTARLGVPCGCRSSERWQAKSRQTQLTVPPIRLKNGLPRGLRPRSDGRRNRCPHRRNGGP